MRSVTTVTLAAVCAAPLLGCGTAGPEPARPSPDVAASATEAPIVSGRPVASMSPAPKAPRTPQIAPPETVIPSSLQTPNSRQASTARTSTVKPKKALSQKWRTRIGLTTFRTTMVFADGKIIVGTHGASLNGKNESDDGVYVLDAATGKSSLKIASPRSGDMDVGGVAVDKGTVYFTGDAGLVATASLETGKIGWQATLQGKVRAAPALADLDGDAALDVVVGDEMGVLSALSGADGKVLWSLKTGENDYNARGFIAAAAIADIDGDGKDDVVAGARDGVLRGIRGTDGREFWEVKDTSGIHASPSIVDFDGDGRKEILAAWSYSDVAVLDLQTGRQLAAQSLSLDGGGIEGLFGSPVPLPGGGAAEGFLVAPSAWWGDEDGVTLAGPSKRVFRADAGRTTASAVVIDLDADGYPEAITVSESGAVFALNGKGQRVELATVAQKTEATPLLADVDGDGTFELIVASGDGNLTCYSTGATSKPLLSRFRGDSPRNTGEIDVRMSCGMARRGAAPRRLGRGRVDE
ncbi:MAG: PQQ-binding-like beta-propeller repeat protein [Polyangiaceae bacterium]